VMPLARGSSMILSMVHQRESQMVATLATKLRVTPQCRYDAQKAHVAVQNTPAVKPWEILGRRKPVKRRILVSRLNRRKVSSSSSDRCLNSSNAAAIWLEIQMCRR
jgi:hypothetical protein